MQSIPVNVQSAIQVPPRASSAGVKNSNTLPWILVGVIEGILFLSLIILLPTSVWDAGRRLVVRYILQSDYLQATSQMLGSPIIIQRVKLKQPGYLVVTLPSQFGTPGDNVNSVAPLLQAGDYTNVPIALDLNFFALPQLRSDAWKKLFVSIYYDNGDGEFDKTVDTVATDGLGSPIFISINLL